MRACDTGWFVKGVCYAGFKALVGMALVLACSAQAEESSGAASSASPSVQERSAELYIFNDSGRTLLSSNQVVTDNGEKVASLPRQTYVKLHVAPGPHLLKPDPPLWKQQVLLDVVAGNRYFVVVAYKPERSWAWPVAGAPLMLREITEEQAAPLLREMKSQ